MKIKSYDDVDEFFEKTKDFLQKQESENNLIIGLIHKNPIKFEKYYLFKIYQKEEEEEEEEIISVCIMTVPHNLLLCYQIENDEIQLKIYEVLINYLFENKIIFPGIIGVKENINNFLKIYQKKTKSEVELLYTN